MAASDRYISVGRMAQLNCVSRKTLHIYQERGILEPRHVDEDSGYRYYTLDQCSILDAVTQLRAIGLSLDEIERILEKGDPAFLREAVDERLDALRREQLKLATALSLAEHVKESCELCEIKPICNQIMFEKVPDRRALIFDVPPVTPNDRWNTEWEMAVRSVKMQLNERYDDLGLFRNVCGIIDQAHLADGSLVTSKAAILLDDKLASRLDDTEVIPGGQYLIMYRDGALLDDGSSPEYAAIQQLLAFAEERELSVAGDYLGETIAGTPALSYQGRDALFKLNLPVTPRVANTAKG